MLNEYESIIILLSLGVGGMPVHEGSAYQQLICVCLTIFELYLDFVLIYSYYLIISLAYNSFVSCQLANNYTSPKIYRPQATRHRSPNLQLGWHLLYIIYSNNNNYTYIIKVDSMVDISFSLEVFLFCSVTSVASYNYSAARQLHGIMHAPVY